MRALEVYFFDRVDYIGSGRVEHPSPRYKLGALPIS
jgi:hypothetical protein